MNSYCYQTYSTEGKILTSGTQHADNLNDLVERLAKRFNVKRLNSGRMVFTDKDKEIRLTVSVNVGMSEHATKLAKLLDEKEAEERQAAAKLEKAKQARLDELLDGMTVEDAIKKLSE